MRACVGCHKEENFTSYRRTPEEFKSIVYRMGQRGAKATTAELDTIADYLAANFPAIDDPDKVNVNKAEAKELETRLGLTAKEAAAIVDLSQPSRELPAARRYVPDLWRRREEDRGREG